MATGKGGTGRRQPVGEAAPPSKRSPRKKARPSKAAGKSTARSDSKSKKGSRKPDKADANSGASGQDGGAATATEVKRTRGDQEVRRLLARPDITGPRVKLGVLWFIAAVASILLGRWTVLGLWSATAALAAWQVTSVWAEQPRASRLPGWGPAASAVTAVVCVAGAGLGTSLGGIALMAAPIVLVIVVTASGRKPAAAGAAVIGSVLAAVPAMSVVLVARDEQWAALFLVVAVSFYDAGYFIGAAESSSRLEGPVTGAIGLLAVTFTASAFEAQPFDRATAWIAGGVMVLACPLGQMLVSAELPDTKSSAPAMRRLDAYLVSGPLMLAAVWAVT